MKLFIPILSAFTLLTLQSVAEFSFEIARIAKNLAENPKIAQIKGFYGEGSTFTAQITGEVIDWRAKGIQFTCDEQDYELTETISSEGTALYKINDEFFQREGDHSERIGYVLPWVRFTPTMLETAKVTKTVGNTLHLIQGELSEKSLKAWLEASADPELDDELLTRILDADFIKKHGTPEEKLTEILFTANSYPIQCKMVYDGDVNGIKNLTLITNDGELITAGNLGVDYLHNYITPNSKDAEPISDEAYLAKINPILDLWINLK